MYFTFQVLIGRLVTCFLRLFRRLFSFWFQVLIGRLVTLNLAQQRSGWRGFQVLIGRLVTMI